VALKPENQACWFRFNFFGNINRDLISPFFDGVNRTARRFFSKRGPHVPEDLSSCNGSPLRLCNNCGSQVAPSPSPSSWLSSPLSLSARRAPACLVRVVHARASGKRSRSFIQSRTVVGPLRIKCGRPVGRCDRGVAPSRGENCGPRKWSVDYSKWQ
jgi:hypothetical protein